LSYGRHSCFGLENSRFPACFKRFPAGAGFGPAFAKCIEVREGLTDLAKRQNNSSSWWSILAAGRRGLSQLPA